MPRTAKITPARRSRRSSRPAVRTRTRKAAEPLGYVLYRGPSAIDGAPIVVILTGFTAARKAARFGGSEGANSKTGAMLQLYIIRSDASPLDAIRKGWDKSICGGCIHRGVYDKTVKRWVRRTCYVEVGKGASNVYRTFHRGRYVDVSGTPEVWADLVRTFGVRFGSYGDPAAIPADTGIVPTLRAAAVFTTGYTHQWRSRIGSHLRGLVMASCDTEQDRTEALAGGWGTFTVIPAAADSVPVGSKVCPASKEAGELAQCVDCQGCSGASGRDYVIKAHGFAASRYTGKRSLPVV